MCGWHVKLCDLSLTRANLSAIKITIAHIIKRYTNVLFTLLYVRPKLHFRVRPVASILYVGAPVTSGGAPDADPQGEAFPSCPPPAINCGALSKYTTRSS